MKRTFIKVVALLMVLVFALGALAGCGTPANNTVPPDNSGNSNSTPSGPDTSDWPKDVVFGGGPSATSTHYMLMSYLSDKLRNDYGIRGTVITGGSEEDIRATQNREHEVSYTVGPSPYWAVTGTEAFNGEPQKDIRLLCMTGDLYALFFSMDDSVKTLSDLRGKKFTGNYAGASYSYYAVLEALAADGMTENDLSIGVYSKAPEAFDNVSSGAAAAGMTTCPNNFATATEFFSTYSKAHLIGLTENEIKAVTDKYSWALKGTVKGGMYANQNDPVDTVRFQMCIMVPVDLPDSFVYQILTYLYAPENRDAFEAIHPVYKTEFTIDRAIDNAIIPFHEAAVQFYKDMGVWSDKAQAKQDALLKELGWTK